MFDNSQAHLESLPSKKRKVRANMIATQDDDQKDQPKLYGTLFLEDGLEDGRPYKMSTNGEALHEVLNADTDHMVPITHIDDWISSANKMIQNRSMVGETIFKHAVDFLSAVDRAKNFAQRDSELQVDVFLGSSGTHEGESIPPSGTEAKNLDDKEGEEHGGGNTDPIDESNKGGNENPPSKTKQRALVLANAENHDNSEEGNEDDDGDKSDKNNEINNIKSSGGVNGLGTGCAAGDLCTMKNAPIAEPYHKCMNCCNLMHGGVCGVLWSEKGVEGSHISRGKYAPLPYIFYSHACFFVSK